MRVAFIEVVRMSSVAELNSTQVRVQSRSVELYEFSTRGNQVAQWAGLGLGEPGDEILGIGLSSPPRRASRKRSRYTYTTGVVNKVRAWLTINPPTIVIPKGRCNSDPVPLPSASGNPPSKAAIVVIMMGRKRRMQAS